MYPLRRNRRLRTNASIRGLVRETMLSPNDFIVLKIEADASWNSSLDRIEVEWS